ncbi:MAG: hypothetical protein KGI29_09870 [Pseudomonadota bacterium]|nr:hypothetical protein [Pseudomonadota bacterium]MDE3038103.1 hypothetical protein [Pseudomonadota bacterium]
MQRQQCSYEFPGGISFTLDMDRPGQPGGSFSGTLNIEGDDPDIIDTFVTLAHGEQSALQGITSVARPIFVTKQIHFSLNIHSDNEQDLYEMTNCLIDYGVSENFFDLTDAAAAKTALSLPASITNGSQPAPLTFRQKNKKWHASGTNADDLQKEAGLSAADMLQLESATSLEELQTHKYDMGKGNYRVNASSIFDAYLAAAKGWEAQQGRGGQRTP